MRNIDHSLNDWLQADPGRRCDITSTSSKTIQMTLVGLGYNYSSRLGLNSVRVFDMLVSVSKTIPTQSSGISGGGSAPTEVQQLIDQWHVQAGFPEMHREAR